jgi:hypothetical protein
MNKRLLLGLVLAVLLLSAFVDRVVCNNWTYHDYAAGFDRRFTCAWQ